MSNYMKSYYSHTEYEEKILIPSVNTAQIRDFVDRSCKVNCMNELVSDNNLLPLSVELQNQLLSIEGQTGIIGLSYFDGHYVGPDAYLPIRIIRNDKSFKFYEWLYRKNTLDNQKPNPLKIARLMVKGDRYQRLWAIMEQMRIQ